MSRKIFHELHAALMCADPDAKCTQVAALWRDWQAGVVFDRSAGPPHHIPDAGRPERPELVEPSALRSRRMGSREGHGAMIHAICHIEFTAINLALDAAWRFRDLPDDYLGDWLRVAADEARHFGLLRTHLRTLGYDYGDFPAHAGLWDMARRTAHDALVRMALVPRVLEARGLDVTPGMIERLRRVGDDETVAVLDVILREEVRHVAIGSRWFSFLCNQRSLDPAAEFLRLVREHAVVLRLPFNQTARLAAGFASAELEALSAHAR